MMIDINRKKLKTFCTRGAVLVLLLAISCGTLIALDAAPFVLEKTVKTATSSGEAADWGLSFTTEGQCPVGNVSREELAHYDAWFAGDDSRKTLYLTFDAGYENGYTAEILDVLQAHKVPAAFFLVGTYIEKHPELVKRMVAEGHIVGNHTMHHPNMSAIAEKTAFLAELEAVETIYQEVTGETMEKYYRPPQGKFSRSNLEQAKAAGYQTIFWSLAYVDWNEHQQPAREEALEKLLPRTHNGAIILLHSTSKTNALVLDELLTSWKADGYQFASLDMLTK